MAYHELISTDELNEVTSNCDPIALIDVRTPMEFQEVHIPGSINIPLNKISNGEVAQVAGDRPVYIVCRTGRRAQDACKILSDDDIDYVSVVNGGVEEWVRAGHDVVRGKKFISIERQVRIAAGSLVFIGTTLGLFIHPGFLAVPAFVGAGLTFAGVTDTCAMGMLIARMPWNQTNPEGEAACSV
jgi:rhodanese-related sulfurtransferase